MKNDIFLQKTPNVRNGIEWEIDKDNIVTLKTERNGIMSKLLKKTKYSYIRLDELGSFVWTQLDGKSDIYIIGKKIESEFGEKTAPLFERLIKYLKILKSYKLIEWGK